MQNIQSLKKRVPMCTLTRAIAVVAVTAFGFVSTTASAATRSHSSVQWYPSGCGRAGSAHNETSRRLPPRGIVGYTRIYCDDFRGSQLGNGWFRFSGQPGGDPGAMFEKSHVTMAAGLLQINTYRDTKGSSWATGGVCKCGLKQTYGAYFVRSRITGPGDDNDLLLWPSRHIWPPEVDFAETSGTPTQTGWYLHFGAKNRQVSNQLHINLLRWHTWGVLWSAHSMTFTVDGHVWGRVTNPSLIPHTPMTLDLQEQTFCQIAPMYPTKPVSMLVDWVAEFAPRVHGR